jgi:hypothetical protein
MGLFSRIFRRKKKDELAIKPSSDAKKVKLEEVDKIIDEKLERFGIDFDSKVQDYKSRFVKHFNSLEGQFDKLENAELERLVLENHRDVTDIIKTSRSHYVQSSRKLINDTIIYLNTEQDPEKLMGTVTNTFDKLNSFSKQAHIILVSFKVEMKPIAESLKMIYADIQSFDEVLKKDYAKIKEKEEMKNIAIKLISVRSSQKRANERINSVEKDLASVLKKKSALVSKRDEILKSSEYVHYERLKDELEDLKQKKAQLLRDIEVQASGAEKIVNAYIHEARDIDKTQSEIVMSMIREPGQLVTNFSAFEDALKNIGKISNNIEPKKKGKKKEKKAVKAPHLLVLRNIRELVTEYEKVILKEERLSKETENSDSVSKLAEVNEKIDEFEMDQKRLMEEKEECTNTISKQFLLDQQRLENYLSELMDEKIRVS